MLNRRALFGLPLMALPSSGGDPPSVLGPERIEAINPRAALALTRRWASTSMALLKRIAATHDPAARADLWLLLIVQARMLEGNAGLIADKARLELRKLA